MSWVRKQRTRLPHTGTYRPGSRYPSRRFATHDAFLPLPASAENFITSLDGSIPSIPWTPVCAETKGAILIFRNSLAHTPSLSRSQAHTHWQAAESHVASNCTLSDVGLESVPVQHIHELDVALSMGHCNIRFDISKCYCTGGEATVTFGLIISGSWAILLMDSTPPRVKVDAATSQPFG
jgi:hypothetical protein